GSPAPATGKTRPDGGGNRATQSRCAAGGPDRDPCPGASRVELGHGERPIRGAHPGSPARTAAGHNADAAGDCYAARDYPERVRSPYDTWRWRVPRAPGPA